MYFIKLFKLKINEETTDIVVFFTDFFTKLVCFFVYFFHIKKYLTKSADFVILKYGNSFKKVCFSERL